MNLPDAVYIILTIVLIIIILILLRYNKIIRILNNVKKEKASIEIYLNKRFDLIPNIVECVKSYSKHEKNTLEKITKLRNNYNEQNNKSIKNVEEINNELNNLIAIVESYPELKANTQYINLHNELSNIEDELEISRHRYNNIVTKYNTLIETVPTNIIASLFAFKKEELFRIEKEQRENVKINL